MAMAEKCVHILCCLILVFESEIFHWPMSKNSMRLCFGFNFLFGKTQSMIELKPKRFRIENENVWFHMEVVQWLIIMIFRGLYVEICLIMRYKENLL